ncbi:hypothetical protein E4U47_002471 [Claviceps purpurea]|nr:hypothetical protein E4U37_004501 [Claviceps purpurea]KAG6258792.1 hypothetical protein E4U48_000594 [Claviceps purpurea]KAG6272584.1 hypothetical protein E4U47_002471 [Claviceps purpurea]
MSTEAGPSNRRRILSDTEIDDTTSEPSKRRRMPPPTELDDTASEGILGNVRNAHTPSRSLTLPPPADPLYSPRDACDAGIMVGKSPGNARIAVALPRIYEARASITGLQTRPLRNKIAAGDLIETTAHPGHYGVMEEKQFR